MYELKTKENDSSVIQFIESVESVDVNVLNELIKSSIEFLKELYPEQ